MMRLAVLRVIKLYQKFLSPDHSVFFSHRHPYGYCKFYPSCSEYAYKSIERFGLRKGGFLAFKRVLRCNPLSQGGIDEVPSLKEAAEAKNLKGIKAHGKQFS